MVLVAFFYSELMLSALGIMYYTHKVVLSTNMEPLRLHLSLGIA